MKNIIITVVVIAAVIGGAMVLSNKKDSSESSNTANTSVSQDTMRVYGNPDAKVVLVEYGDFECPGCGAFYPIVKQVKETYKDDLRFEFKNFPLVQIHLNAQSAHRAAHAAGLQGRFWEMHDKLYEGQSSWRSSQTASRLFESYASDLELDMDKYAADYASSATNDAIKADVEEGKKLGVSGTPTFFLNGKEIEDTSKIDTVEEFNKLIEDAINDSKNQP